MAFNFYLQLVIYAVKYLLQLLEVLRFAGIRVVVYMYNLKKTVPLVPLFDLNI